MCGIAGIVDFTDSLRGEDLVARGVSAIRHRGPDAEHVWHESGVTLGHARLSILDLSPEADQPMLDAEGRVAIVFNGEIYNYRQLGAELRALGHEFRTHSDTEVLLEAYLEWGDDMLPKLEGMFAFALWDRARGRVLLARDRLGIKPLFYAFDGTRLAFASEIKGLLAMLPSLAGELDRQAFREFLWFGNPLGERTMYARIRRVLAGEYLSFARGERAIRRTRFWCITDVNPVSDDFETARVRVRDLLGNAVRSHLVSDVPIGIMLSGGIDSSAIAVLAARGSTQRLSTYSIAFDFEDRGELPAAAALARELGSDHHELYVRADQVETLMRKLISCHDEPFADAANIPLYLATRELRGHVKVVLQGDGGDEMFAGYRRYEVLGIHAPWRLLRALSVALIPRTLDLPDAVRRVLRMTEAMGAPAAERAALLLSMDSERRWPEQILTEEARDLLRETDPFQRYREVLTSLPPMDDTQAMLWADASILLPDTFLEKVDKSTMANGIEVRVPFLDVHLAEYALGLPAAHKVVPGMRKRVLRAALRGVVPDRVLDAPKKGFGVPYGTWLRGPLRQTFEARLADSRAIRDGVLSDRRLAELARQHCSGRRDHSFLLWKALQFMEWYETYPVRPA